MKTSHWLWLGEETRSPAGPTARIGKKNLINNFCIATRGNERSCMKCHAGYGWLDDTFDFAKSENVDCLVCHERTGTYVKGPGGIPTKGSDLVAAARSVAPRPRELHHLPRLRRRRRGGEARRHRLVARPPSGGRDVHIGKHGFLCVDCHAAPGHQIEGRAFSVSVEDQRRRVHRLPRAAAAPGRADRRAPRRGRLPDLPHPDLRAEDPDKANWDWSKAGDAKRAEDPHHYLKIKGEFAYEQDAVPEYRWFNLTVSRYLLGDRIDPSASPPSTRRRGA